jgi:hypothetical protein
MAVSRFQSFEVKSKSRVRNDWRFDWWRCVLQRMERCVEWAPRSAKGKVSGKTNYPTLAKGRPGWGTLKDIDE